MVAAETLLENLLLQHRVEQFYYQEADLLDGWHLDEWLALLADDVRYWMPITRNLPHTQHRASETREGEDVNWIDEGRRLLELRVEQVNSQVHWAEEPLSRISRAISNVRVQNGAEDGGLEARCRFAIYRNRGDHEVDLFAGKRIDQLRPDGDSFKIARREVHLDQSVLLSKNLTIFF